MEGCGRCADGVERKAGLKVSVGVLGAGRVWSSLAGVVQQQL